MSLIEPGTYRARGVTGELGFTNKGDEQIAITFAFSDLPGKRLAWYGGFSTELNGQATKTPCDRTFETLRTCGWTGDDLSDLAGIDANEVEIVVEIDEYNGEERNRIKWVNQLGGGAALKNVMPVDAKKAFAARMKGHAVASRQKMPAQSQAQRPAQGQRPQQGQRQEPPRGAGDAWEPKDEDAPNW